MIIFRKLSTDWKTSFYLPASRHITPLKFAGEKDETSRKDPWDWYIYLYTWLVDLYGKLVGKYITLHWCYGLVKPTFNRESFLRTISKIQWNESQPPQLPGWFLWVNARGEAIPSLCAWTSRRPSRWGGGAARVSTRSFFCRSWEDVEGTVTPGGGFMFFVYFHPYLGKISNLANIFQMGWNHQQLE